MSMTFERRNRTSDKTNKRDGPKVAKPKPEDFNPGKVAMDVGADALNHPATSYPFCVAIGAAVCAIAIPATLPIAASIATIGLVTSGASWYYNYVLKGEEKVVQRYEFLREQRRQYEMHELGNLIDSCKRAGFEKGCEEATKLDQAYQPLLDYFKEKLTGKSNAVIEQFQGLAADTYKQGVSVLGKALDMSKALNSVDIKSLENDLEEWKSELSKAKADSTQAETLEDQISISQQEIELYNKQRDQLLELLAQAKGIRSALRVTRLNLADLGNQDINKYLTNDGDAATRLRSTVEAARKVEQQLRGNNKEQKETDDRYRKAAKRRNSVQE